MCTQSTKDVLERMLHSSDFHALCPVGPTKTSPLGSEVPGSVGPPRAPAVCPRRADYPCTSCGRSRKDSLHSTNPAFRLASPSPSLTRVSLALGDTREDGFISLP